MLKVPKRLRIWIFLFALWLAIEPMAVSIATAQSLPQSKQKTWNSKELTELLRKASENNPDEMFDQVYKVQGGISDKMDKNKIKGAIAGRAFFDFLMTVSTAYDLMGADAADTVSIIDVLGQIQSLADAKDQIDYTNKGIFKITGTNLLGKFDEFANRAAKKLFMFFGRAQRAAERGSWKRNVLKGFTKSANAARKIIPKISEFLEYMNPPEGIENSKKYFSFFTKGTESGLNKTQFAAQSVGIGLAAINLILGAHSLTTRDDIYGKKLDSYANVKDIANIGVALSVALAMIWAAPFGTIASIGGMIVLIASFIGDKLGEFNAKWKQAYRQSFDFLWREDPEFRTFYEKRNQIVPERRSAAWLVADRQVKEWRKNASGDAKKRIEAIYNVLERQGVLATYYNRAKFKLPNLDLNGLQELWKKKADYMAWKPTKEEIEAAKNQSTFSKIVEYVAIWNYPVWGINKVRESLADKEMKKQLEAYPPVYFNPDFVLMRRYQNFLMAKKERRDTFYDLVGLRIEQAPFNYIWMLGMDTSQWNQDLMVAALEGDVFICGVKEMQYLHKVMEQICEQLRETIKKSDERLANAKEFCDNMRRQRTALEKLISTFVAEEAESADKTSSEDGEGTKEIDWQDQSPNNKHRQKFFEVWKPCHGAFDWRATAFGKQKKMNAKNIIKTFKADIEQRMAALPASINRKILEMHQIDLMIKSVQDRYALYEKLYKDRDEAIKAFDNDFGKYPALKAYLEKMEFLGVGGVFDRFKNWLSGIYPAKREMEHYTDLYKDAIDKYKALIDKAASKQRGWWIFKYDFPDPDEICKRLNEELQALKKVVEKFEKAASDDFNIEIIFSDEAWYKERPLLLGKEHRKPMDPTSDIIVDAISVDF